MAKSTASGGGSSQTSSNGGGTSTSTQSGGGSSQTSGVSSNWAADILPLVTSNAYPSGDTHNHVVTISMSDFSHKHDTVIPAHTHQITLPDHIHEIKHGIYEFGTLPSSVQITVDGAVVPLTALRGDRIDLIPYLQKDSSGKIQPGIYAEIIVKPNNLARINATVSSRLFIQSRIGEVM